jgi:hypothetical protein
MAKEQKNSLSSKVKTIFREHPELLEVTSNARFLEIFKDTHGHELDKKGQQVLNNVKSVLRREARGGKPAKARKKAARAAAVATVAAATKAAPGRNGRAAALEQLEDRIDYALALAREIDPLKLEEVVKALRKARHKLILILGD